MKIDKELSLTMKGMAIMFIALHNFLHLERFGLVQENEMQFDINRTIQFFEKFQIFSGTIIYDIFSFIGWCGVPVFVFLSGYGLSMKYENSGKRINTKSYIVHSYKKLLLLVIPATLFFVTYQCLDEQYLKAFFSVFSSITFLNTLISYGISIPSAAPPYWYFALTLQLYVIYLLLYRLTSYKSLIYIALILLSIQIIINSEYFPTSELLHYLRKNAFGWLPYFILGILCARNGSLLKVISHRWIVTILMIMSFAALFLMNLNYYIWVIMPFASILFFLSLSVLLNDYSFLRKVGCCLGNYSPYIFVTHPISMIIVLKFMDNIQLRGMWVWLIIYILLILSISAIYRVLHIYLLNYKIK